MPSRKPPHPRDVERLHPIFKLLADSVKSQWLDAERMLARIERALASKIPAKERENRALATRLRALLILHGTGLTMAQELAPMEKRFDQGPLPNQTKDEFLREVVKELAEAVTEMPALPMPVGRPPKAALMRRVPRPPGRPRRYDPAAIQDAIAAQVSAAASEGRRVTRMAALCDEFAKEMKSREPRRYRRLMELVRFYEEEGLSSRRALCKALNSREMTASSPNLPTVARVLQHAKKPRSSRR